MTTIKRINHVGLRIRELATARAFYEKLGFDFIAGPLGPEPVAIMKHPSGVNLNFIVNASADAADTNLLMDMREKHTGYTHIALEVDDLSAVEQTVLEADIAITERVNIPEGAAFFFVRDPDGNVLEFHQPA